MAWIQRIRYRLLTLISLILVLGTVSPSLPQQPLLVKLVSLTSPTHPGANATIIVKTAPAAACSIAVFYKSGTSRAQGLVPKTADAQGNASWTWRVGTRTTPGTWPILVTCSLGGRQGKLKTSFDVQ